MRLIEFQKRQSILDRIVWPVVISLLAGALTGWGASRIETESRLSVLETDVKWIRDAVARIEHDLTGRHAPPLP